MKLLMVINPIAGGKDKDSFLEEAESTCRTYGIDLDYFHTTGKEDLRKLKEKVKSVKPDRVISVGGDGTIRMTCIALLETDIPVGIIPMGSANGMAKELNIPADPSEAFLNTIMSHMIIPMDLVKVNGEHYSLHLGDVGANANMVEKFSQEKERGWLSYAKHFVDAIQNTDRFDLELIVNGKKVNLEAYAVVIANARMYGTGAIVNPKGNPHDGLFEIVVVKQSDLSGIINLGLTTISERALENLEEYYDIYQVEKAEVRFNEPKLLQLDGELIGKFETVKAEIVPAASHLITTSDNTFLDTPEDG